MRKVLTLLLLLLGAIAIWFLVDSVTRPQESDYAQAVKAYQKISMDQLEEKVEAQEDFLLYIGRETCPYCQTFVPKLTEAVEETHVTVYYVDSEKDPDGRIQAFRQENGLKTVPSLTYYRSGQLAGLLRKGSQASMAEIKDFLALLGK